MHRAHPFGAKYNENQSNADKEQIACDKFPKVRTFLYDYATARLPCNCLALKKFAVCMMMIRERIQSMGSGWVSYGRGTRKVVWVRIGVRMLQVWARCRWGR